MSTIFFAVGFQLLKLPARKTLLPGSARTQNTTRWFFGAAFFAAHLAGALAAHLAGVLTAHLADVFAAHSAVVFFGADFANGFACGLADTSVFTVFLDLLFMLASVSLSDTAILSMTVRRMSRPVTAF
ncbi:MAG: hypothetical protein PHG74_05210 [Kiritimatiellae bacterium]|nr:hypothetical protein [Kiritimatiellia bacterium]MDD3583403.1 hypothetical protein [Kiritimatiellia bacterium]HON48371.1 hypothetical protein [Kiritimatiellia bacterium]